MHQLLHNKSLRLWLLLLTLAASAAVSMLLYRRANLDSTQQRAQQGQQTADFIIHTFKGLTYDQNGVLQYEMLAEQLIQYPNALTQIKKPIITTGEKSAAIWRISADTGSIDKQQQLITLQDHVLITQAQNAEPPIFTTTYLQLFPERDLVTTDHQVQILQASGKILSTGMTSKIHSREVTLKSDVSGHYDPPVLNQHKTPPAPG
jgi:hypothetical protein